MTNSSDAHTVCTEAYAKKIDELQSRVDFLVALNEEFVQWYTQLSNSHLCLTDDVKHMKTKVDQWPYLVETPSLAPPKRKRKSVLQDEKKSGTKPGKENP